MGKEGPAGYSFPGMKKKSEYTVTQEVHTCINMQNTNMQHSYTSTQHTYTNMYTNMLTYTYTQISFQPEQPLFHLFPYKI